MLTVLFYVVIVWAFISLGRGVYASVFEHKTSDQVVSIVTSTFVLPYKVVRNLFK